MFSPAIHLSAAFLLNLASDERPLSDCVQHTYSDCVQLYIEGIE